MRGDLVQAPRGAVVALDRDDASRAPSAQQRARQAAGAGSDLDDGDARERTGGARDAAR